MKSTLVLFALLLLSACENTPPEDITDPGQLLFLGYAKKPVNCGRCHGPHGQGGMQAPDLRQVFSKHSRDEIMTIIEEGRGEGDDAMPPFESDLSEVELARLVDFLQTLQKLE